MGLQERMSELHSEATTLQTYQKMFNVIIYFLSYVQITVALKYNFYLRLT